MAWNLADEINTDENVDSLFDSLPTQSKALERDEVIRTADAGGDLNTSAEGSFVTNSKIPTLESPKEKAATDSALGEIQTDLGRNVLETFEAPKKKEAAKETAEEEEYEDEPEEEYLGRTLAAGQLLISNLKYAQDGRIGRNAREFQMEKRLDDQAIAAVRAQMQRNLKGLEYDPGLFDALATRKGGGRRPAEEITELIRIQKNKGALILNDEGKEAFAPANDWEEAEKVYDLRSAQKMKLVVSGKTAKDTSQEDLTKAMANYKAAQEAFTAAQTANDPTQLSSSKIAYGMARDNLNQVSGGRLYREEHDANQKMVLKALNNVGNSKVYWNGAAYDDPIVKNSQDPMARLSAEQFLENQVTTGVVPTIAPTKNGVDTSAADAYLKQAGVNSGLVGMWNGPQLVFFNYNPSAKEPLVIAKTQAPPASEAKKSSEVASPNESGKRLGAAVKPALQKTANFLKGPTADELLNRADYVATGIRNNITAPAVEWAAGVAGEDLDMGRTPNPSVADRDKKQLTAEERAAILSRTQNPLTTLFLNK